MCFDESERVKKYFELISFLSRYNFSHNCSAVDDSYDQVVRRPRFIQANKVSILVDTSSKSCL